MKNSKALASFLVFLLTGCVVVPPKITSDGRYLTLYANGLPVSELEYPEPVACGQGANQLTELSPEFKRAVIAGTLRVECARNSLGAKLPYESSLVNIFTGQRYLMKTFSREACLYVLKQNTEQAWKYDCP
jgi:hypothetical protein